MGEWEGIKEQPFVVSQRVWLSQSYPKEGIAVRLVGDGGSRGGAMERRREKVKEERSILVPVASLWL